MATVHPTLLSRLVREGRWTIEETCAAFERTAREMGEDATLSIRQIGRWMDGEVGRPRPVSRRVAEKLWGRPFHVLLGPDRAEPPMIDPPPGALALQGSVERPSSELVPPTASPHAHALLAIITNVTAGAVFTDGRSPFGPAERVARAATVSGAAAGSLSAGPMASAASGHHAGRPRSAGHLLAERSQELFVRGYGLLGANDRREVGAAKVLLDRAVMREPQFARAIAARGYASWRHYFAGWTRQAQELTSAICDIHEALTIDPESVQAHLTFVRVCWDMGWHEPAVAAGRFIFDRNPDSLEATIALARALNNAGLSQYAIPLIGSVLTTDPTNPAATKLNIWCHLMVGDFAHAVSLARAYLPGRPNDANTRWAAALAHRHLSDGAEALRIAEQAADADPDDVTVWVLLGYLHRWLGDEASARASWSAGLDRVGTDVSSNRTKAWAANLQAGLGHEVVAREMAREIRSSEPENAYLCYRLAHVYAELGDGGTAISMLDSATNSGFLSVQLARREEVLATSKIRTLGGYVSSIERLGRRVGAAARDCIADLTPAPVRPNLGWSHS